MNQIFILDTLFSIYFKRCLFVQVKFPVSTHIFSMKTFFSNLRTTRLNKSHLCILISFHLWNIFQKAKITWFFRFINGPKGQKLEKFIFNMNLPILLKLKTGQSRKFLDFLILFLLLQLIFTKLNDNFQMDFTKLF